MTYEDIPPLDKIRPGDQFTHAHLPPDSPEQEPEWYPCETFIGRRVADIQRYSSVRFRRPKA